MHVLSYSGSPSFHIINSSILSTNVTIVAECTGGVCHGTAASGMAMDTVDEGADSRVWVYIIVLMANKILQKSDPKKKII